MIHAWSAYGEEAASEHHFSKYYRRTSRLATPTSIASVIRGKLDFLRMVKGTADPVYRNLQSQFVKVFPDYLAIMQKENSVMLQRDVFISHSSKDKQDFAKPLADALISAGISVWYDEYEIKLGDSLLQKINEGLANSRYGIVVLSKSFFERNWPRRELDGLAAMENADGKPRILPVWHGCTFAEVAKLSPILAGLKAADSSTSDIPEIVKQVMEVVKPVRVSGTTQAKN
jgi:hypothetical protein